MNEVDIAKQLEILKCRARNFRRASKCSSALVLAFSLLAMAFAYVSNGLYQVDQAQIHIPDSLLSVTPFEFNLYGVFEFFKPFMKWFCLVVMVVGVVDIFISARLLSMSVVTVGFVLLSYWIFGQPANFEPYHNNSVVSEIVNHDLNNPVSTKYIEKVDRLDERYLLAQVASLSGAAYPDAFYKGVLKDMEGTTRPEPFVPTWWGKMRIEKAIYGDQFSPLIANEISERKNITSILRSMNVISWVLSWLGGLSAVICLVLAYQINNRVFNIQNMIKFNGVAR